MLGIHVVRDLQSERAVVLVYDSYKAVGKWNEIEHYMYCIMAAI